MGGRNKNDENQKEQMATKIRKDDNERPAKVDNMFDLFYINLIQINNRSDFFYFGQNLSFFWKLNLTLVYS